MVTLPRGVVTVTVNWPELRVLAHCSGGAAVARDCVASLMIVPKKEPKPLERS